MTSALLFPLVILLTAADQGPLKIQADATDNSVLKSLIEPGVKFGPGADVPMMKPVMPDGMTSAEQIKVLEELAGPRRRVSDLLKDSRVAPFVSQNEHIMMPAPLPDANSVNVYFVAHGPFEVLTQDGFLRALFNDFGGNDKNKLPARSGQFEAEDLAKWNLEATDANGIKVRYSYNTFTLLDRVYINSTRRIVATQSEESLVVAANIETRLTNDPEYPNNWQSVDKDKLAKTVLVGEKQPHEAAAFYLKATKLKSPEGAIFVEYHHLFHVPHGWFNGAPLLRAKLPTIAQDTVRKFRLKLKEPPAPTTKP